MSPGLPLLALSSMTGRLCAMLSVLIPGYLMVVMVGRKKAMEVLPAIIACGVSFAGVQFFVSNYMGPELTDILSSLTCIGVMVLVLKLWKPKEIMRLEGDKPITVAADEALAPGQVFMAWLPYMLLVVAVLTFGEPSIKARINAWTDGFMPDSVRAEPVAHPTAAGTTQSHRVPGLHNMITQVPPVVPKKTPYAALFELNWLTASGTACFLATIAAALCLGVGPRQFARHLPGNVQATQVGDADDCIDARPCLSDELFGNDVDAGTFARRNGRRCFLSSAPLSDGSECS